MAIKETKRHEFSLKSVVVLVCAAMIAVSITVVSFNMTKERKPVLTDTFIHAQIMPAGELISSKMIYNGLITYSDGNIPFLTKKGFSMIYRAEIEAGVQLKDVDVNILSDKVVLTVPPVDTFDITIEPESVQFYDEKFALLNWDKKQDVIEAMKFAKEDVMENGQLDELAELAQEQTTAVLTGFLQNVVGDRTISVEFKKSE